MRIPSPLYPRQSRQAFEADAQKTLRDAFSRHEIRSREAFRWVLERRLPCGQWCGELATEVTVLRPVGDSADYELLVRGALDVVVWGGYRPPGDVRDVDIVQAAAREDLGTFRRRVMRGLGGAEGASSFVETWVPAVLHDDLATLDAMSDAACAALRAALRRLDDFCDATHCARIVDDLLAARAIDSEAAASLGRVTTTRVLHAHAAVMRLAEILDRDKP